MALSWLKSQPTYLSPEVKYLLNKAGQDTKELSSVAPDCWLSLDYKLKWENIESTFESISETYGSKDWFKKAVENLAPLFSQCDRALRDITPEDYVVHLQPYLKWTYQEGVLSDCIKLLHPKKSETDHLLALLMITSLTERALGNLLLTRQKQVPFLLRDLLITPELQDIIGKPKSHLLVVLVGSVLGLNLRNIAWHGFLSPGEAKSSFVATILFILADCGRNIKNTPGLEDRIPQRPNAYFSELEHMSSVFETVPLPDREALEEVVRKSLLVPDIMVPVWSRTFTLLDDKRYDFCLTLLLPMLECSMRCLFGHVNGVSARVLTAENSSFYTTLDEILCLEIKKENEDTLTPDNLEDSFDHLTVTEVSHNLDAFDGCCNKEIDYVACSGSFAMNLVPLVIGRQVNEALHDVFNFVQGPRVRDKLSHGEMQLDLIPKSIVHHIICLSLLLLTLGNLTRKTKVDEEYRSLYNIEQNTLKGDSVYSGCSWHFSRTIFDQIILPFKAVIFSESAMSALDLILNAMMDYKCAYHPSAVLQRNLMSCTVKLKEWTGWRRVCSSDLNYPDWDTAELIALPENIAYSFARAHKVFNLNNISDFKTYIADVHYSVLYRPKSELELVTLLNRIVCCLQSALENMENNLTLKYSQFMNKTLRSRQRETYRRQLTAVPTLVLNCYFTCQVICSIFDSAHSLQSDKSCISNLMKSLRKILKLNENIVSQTSINMNRWDEAHRNSIENINHIEEYFGK